MSVQSSESVGGRWRVGAIVGVGGWSLACRCNRRSRWVDAGLSVQSSESVGGRWRVGAVVGVVGWMPASHRSRCGGDVVGGVGNVGGEVDKASRTRVHLASGG